MSIISKKVNRTINENILTLEDIQTRKEWWKKPGEEDYFEFKIYTGWNWWDKYYKFLPTPDKYQEIRKETFAKLKELPSEEYFIIRNRNNTLTIILQNKRQLDFERPDIVIFFGANPRKPELEERLWRMYFISSFDYINNENLYIQITAEKDYVWKFYGNFVNSKGFANISTSNLGFDHVEHKEDWNTQNARNCPACDMCFDFCGDLRNKRATPPGFTKPNLKPAQWQPQFKMMYTLPISKNLVGASSTASVNITNDEGEVVVAVPTNLKLKTWNSGIDLGSLLKDSATPSLIYLVAEEHWNKKDADAPFSDPVRYPTDKKDYLWEELPKCYQEQPHLLNHSSVQFYFQKKVVMTANLKHVHIRRKKIDASSEPIWLLGYRILVRSSIAGILYCFESGDIFFKWELKVKGSIINNTFLSSLLGGILKGTMDKLVKGGMKIADNFLKSWTGISFMGGEKEKEKKSPRLGDVMSGKKYEELLGLEEKGDRNKDKPENEQQTERMKKSTAKSQNRIVEPALFYTNTVDFNYDFWEFANRSISNPFAIRFEHSEVLYNNLVNNNNKAPIQNIQCRFSAFKQCIKVGEFQGEVKLLWDIDNQFSSICGGGTFFYDNLNEIFKPWRPRYKTLQSFTHGDTFNSGVGIGEEEVEIIKVEKEEMVGGFDALKMAYGYITYIRCDNEALFEELYSKGWTSHNTKDHDKNDNKYVISQDYSKEWAFCWGCSNKQTELTMNTGGTVYAIFDKDLTATGPEEVINLPTNQEYTLIIDTQKGEFRVKTFEETLKTRFKFDRIQVEREEEYQTEEFEEPVYDDVNTQFHSNIGEVDPNELGDLEKDNELKETQFDKPETELKEKSGESEKDMEKELQKEKQREQELERERERELEREKEKERERELEREKDREKEKLLETERQKEMKEKMAEQEKKETQRKERETKLRERQQQREQVQKEKAQKDKEKKERE